MNCILKQKTSPLNLAFFQPETFARIKWLLEVSKFLLESPKPEAYWLTNTDIAKLISEAKTFNETSIWIKNTRINLMDRYNPSLYTLVLNRSTEITQQLEALSKMLPAVVLEEGEFLQKREKLLAFVKTTQLTARKWSENAHALAPMLGLDVEGLTIKQLKELSRIAQLVFADR